MSKLLIVIVIGPPGCGKSTLCSQLSSALEPYASTVVFCYDKLIPSLAFRLNPTTENTEWRTWRQAVLQCVECLILCFRNHSINELLVTDEMKHIWSRLRPPQDPSARDLVVILDDNFYYTSMRRPFFSLAKQYDCGFATIQCHCSLETCLQRNATRLEPVPEATVIHIVNKFEPADEISNYWERHTCHVNCSSFLTETEIGPIIHKLLLAIRSPFSCAEEDALREQKSLDRQINLNSILHVVDNALRGHVRCLLRTKDSSWKKVHGKSVGRVKADILSRIRSSISRETNGAGCSVAYYQNMAVTLFDEKISTFPTQ